ncbi:hypothetical protein [Vibrio sp. WXL103]|uniref:hypothetical protein n=1 Tax=Vibrio sp. WXL103 TaxID=3450710 RepID=UPI003EC8E047
MKNHRYVYATAICITLLLCALIVMTAGALSVGELNYRALGRYECEVSKATGNQVFKIYTPVSMGNQPLSQVFCDTLLVDSQYSRVVVSHLPRAELRANHFSTEPFNLVFSRDYFMQSVLPGYTSFYAELLVWPSYQVYWLSHLPLSTDLYQSARIALLDDQKSQSGYMEPLKFLTHLGQDIGDLDLHYFHNRDSMQRAFQRGEIDMMPIATFDSPVQDDTRYHSTLINDKLTLGSWYVHRSVSTQTAMRIRAMLSRYFAVLKESTSE